jgi:hypothetical protein
MENANEILCPKHPTYKAIRPPKRDCFRCWKEWGMRAKRVIDWYAKHRKEQAKRLEYAENRLRAMNTVATVYAYQYDRRGRRIRPKY